MRLEAKRYLFRMFHLECPPSTWWCYESIRPYKSVPGSNGTEGITPTTSIFESSSGLVATSPCTSLLHLRIQNRFSWKGTNRIEVVFEKLISIPVSSKRSTHLANIDSRLFNYQLIFTNNHQTINNFPNYLLTSKYVHKIYFCFQSFENSFKSLILFRINFPKYFISPLKSPSTKNRFLK